MFSQHPGVQWGMNQFTMVKHVHLRIHTWKQESLKVQPGDGVRSDHTVEHLGWLLHKDSFCVWDGGYTCVYSSIYRIFVYVWVCMFKSVHVCWGQSMISSIISQKLSPLCFETQPSLGSRAHHSADQTSQCEPQRCSYWVRMAPCLAFSGGCYGPNTGTHICMISTILMEPFPKSCFLEDFYFSNRSCSWQFEKFSFVWVDYPLSPKARLTR